MIESYSWIWTTAKSTTNERSKYSSAIMIYLCSTLNLLNLIFLKQHSKDFSIRRFLNFSWFHFEWKTKISNFWKNSKTLLWKNSIIWWISINIFFVMMKKKKKKFESKYNFDFVCVDDMIAIEFTFYVTNLKISTNSTDMIEYIFRLKNVTLITNSETKIVVSKTSRKRRKISNEWISFSFKTKTIRSIANFLIFVMKIDNDWCKYS